MTMSKSQVDAMEETLVTYTLERDGKVFVVEYVPARVSQETGEAFFSPETVDRLQAIIAGKSHMKATSQDPDVLGGELVFAGTRVPVKSLFDHLEGGDSIEDFLEGFPSVQREQVMAVLEESREHALAVD
jgi:uncharacterized protein (DUF433 family)